MRYKYPRTYHLPFSEGYTSDDKVLKDDSHLIGKEIVITEKMDGENTSIYNNGFHARSMDSLHKEYHSWLINYMQNFMYCLPDNYRICGEYLFAKHSIEYNELPTYFMAFSVWNDTICLSWEETETFCKELNVETVPVLYKGIYDTKIVKEIAKQTVIRGGEGIVVRLASSYNYNDFDKSVAKFVRKNHVQTDKHWSHSEIKQNGLKEK